MITQCGNIKDFVPFLCKILDGNVVDCSAKLLSSQGFGSVMWVVRARVETRKRSDSMNEVRSAINFFRAREAEHPDSSSWRRSTWW